MDLKDVINILVADVPKYLHQGAFFKSLDCENNVITVPSNVVKPDTSIRDTNDLSHLLLSLRFWIVSEVPRELIAYVINSKQRAIKAVLCDFSAEFGCLQVWSKLSRYSPQKQMHIALVNGYVELVEYFSDLGVQCKSCYSTAAAAGQLKCLQILHEHRYPWDAFACIAAARSGNLECLRYAHQMGCSEPGNVSNVVVNVGCFPHMYTHHGCSWTREVCTEAAKHGHLECLIYAHEHGCAWNWEATWYAKARGHTHCVKYLKANGCPG